ncbi:MAG: FAD-binding oxidoreductase [Halieaceae bacterium]|jgi:glycine/D-amino acid oxidase-like deaminating enzyme|nr:FAD-binding oxidoreductase [Halieaceae bacterium]
MEPVETVICGAGIAGIATAYYLSVRYNRHNTVLVDRLLPMSLTTSKSGENYRDYWPQACMTEFVSHSLDLINELCADVDPSSVNVREVGYDFISRHADSDLFPASYNDDFDNTGRLNRTTDPSKISLQKPYLADSVKQIVHIPRAGFFDVNGLGSLMLSKARKAGVQFQQANIENIDQREGSGFTLILREDGKQPEKLSCQQLVLAPGPFINNLANMLGQKLAIENYLQRKFIIPDPAGVVPEDMPFTICADPVYLEWSEHERQLIEADPEFSHLLDQFPPGLHIKPEGKNHVKLGWAINRQQEAPNWEISDDPLFADIVLRGASQFIPGIKQYIGNMPTPIVQFAGYYTRTRENWPIIGPMDIDGLYAVAGLSGYGTMSACGAGELCADWMYGNDRPGYARNFHPTRYNDATVQAEIDSISSDGQL